MKKLVLFMCAGLLISLVGCGGQPKASDIVESENSIEQTQNIVENTFESASETDEFEPEESFELIEYDIKKADITQDMFSYIIDEDEYSDGWSKKKFIYRVYAVNETEYDFYGLSFVVPMVNGEEKQEYHGCLKAGTTLCFAFTTEYRLGNISVTWDCERASYTNTPIDTSSTFTESMKGTYKESDDVKYVISETDISVYNGEKLSKQIPYKVIEFNGEQCLFIDYGNNNGAVFARREDGIFTHAVYQRDGELVLYFSQTCLDRDYNWLKRTGGNSEELVKPAIGMTADEVRNSLWGSPTRINKNEYSFGVKEQWIYGNGRYVYLEDGVVTAIQERE